MGGEGLAIWYAKERGVEGPVYGSKDKWQGERERETDSF
jgi:mannose-binding lectin 1